MGKQVIPIDGKNVGKIITILKISPFRRWIPQSIKDIYRLVRKLTNVKLKLDFYYFNQHPTIAIPINNILAEWDPIGVSVSQKNMTLAEYFGYIPYIISVYISNESLYDFMIELQLYLSGMLTQENVAATKKASDKILYNLSNHSIYDLKSSIPDWREYLQQVSK